MTRRGRPADGGVPPHHVLVRDDVGPADVEGAVDVVRQPRASHEEAEHVADGDRLDARAYPARGHHHGEPLGQIPQHLERGRTRPDDHGGPQRGGGDPRGQEDAAHFGAGPQVRGQRVLGYSGRGQPAQVDDPPDSGGARLLAEDPGRASVGLFETPPGAQRVHQVVRDVHPLHRRAHGHLVRHVPAHDLRLPGPWMVPQPARRAGQTAHGMPGRQQLRHQPAAQVTGGTGDQTAQRPVVVGQAGRSHAGRVRLVRRRLEVRAARNVMALTPSGDVPPGPCRCFPESMLGPEAERRNLAGPGRRVTADSAHRPCDRPQAH